MEKEYKPKRRLSILNWMGTIIVCSIPGINIISLILFIIFAKSQSKRNFAWAALLLIIILAITSFAAFILFGEQLAGLSQWLRDTANQLAASSVQ